MNGPELYEFARQLAVEHVCPYAPEPRTIYEMNTVKAMTQFALRVITAYERKKFPGAHDVEEFYKE